MRHRFHRSCCWLLLALVAVAAKPGGSVKRVSLETETEARYALFTPPKVVEGQSYPLILALHGASGDVDGPISWWSEIAAERGYFICAPKSRNISWPYGDQSHVTKILAEVEQENPIDRKRVLITGVSDGGTYSYILAFQDPSLFKAIVPISGVLPGYYQRNLKFLPKLPICVLHGTEDSIFPVKATRQAVSVLTNAHCNLLYLEIEGGKHGWFPQKAGEILDWFEKLPN